MLVQEPSAHLRSPRTVRRFNAAAGVLACALAFAFAPAAASAANPPANIPLGSMPGSCSQESSSECQQWLLSRLDAARESLGLAAYQLPGDFLTLSPDKQIFILADLDRTAYGYTPISGLNTALDEAAAAGVRNETDPRPPATEAPWNGFGSDWASTGPLLGYYLWMYDDGYPGPNLDCGTPTASGCWGHRHVILGEGLPLPQPEVVGIATGTSPSGTALIVSSHTGAATYYTWAQAESEGAGSGGGTGTGTGGEEKTEPPPTPPPTGGEETPEPPPTGGEESPEPPPTGGEEAPKPPPPAKCTRVGGVGAISISVLHGRVSDQLTTALSGKQSLQSTITYPPVGVMRLTKLTGVGCSVTGSGREFHGVGSATLNGVGGYTASFTFFVGPSRSTFSLKLTKGSKVRVHVLGIPLKGSTEAIS